MFSSARRISTLLLIILLQLSSSAFSKDNLISLSDSEVNTIVTAVGNALIKDYVFPDTAKKIDQLLKSNLRNNSYKKFHDPLELSERLTDDIRSVTGDAHLSVSYTGPSTSGGMRMRMVGGKNNSDYLQSLKRKNYGFKEVKILPGNVGYINITEFVNPEFAGETAVATMSFVQDTDAIIFDLRENRGGAGEMYQLLVSYLFDEGPIKINEIYWPGEDRRYQTWTLPHLPGKRLPNTEVYILTSGKTGSAAEVFSYALKNLERATLIGEKTVGAANPISPSQIHEHFLVWMSKGIATNPITKSNWEGVGVLPDLNIDSSKALSLAHLEALKSLKTKHADSSAYFDWNIEIANSELEKIDISNSKLQSFSGQYKSPMGEIREISFENGKLYYGTPGSQLEKLSPISEDTFMLQGNDTFKLTIETSETGKVKGLVRRFDSGRVIPMAFIN